MIAGVEERGALARCDAVLSGYQGAEDVGAVVLDAVARVKAANPARVYCCDPVMGDVGRGMFVRPGIPELMRDRVVPAADVITPNHFELDFLAGHHARPRCAGCSRRPTGSGRPARPSCSSPRCSSTTPRRTPWTSSWCPPTARGAPARPGCRSPPTARGDLTAAVFLAHLLDGRALDDALARTTSAVFAVVEATAAAGDRELRIVQTQELLAEPRMEFEALRVR